MEHLQAQIDETATSRELRSIQGRLQELSILNDQLAQEAGEERQRRENAEVKLHSMVLQHQRERTEWNKELSTAQAALEAAERKAAQASEAERSVSEQGHAARSEAERLTREVQDLNRELEEQNALMNGSERDTAARLKEMHSEWDDERRQLQSWGQGLEQQMARLEAEVLRLQAAQRSAETATAEAVVAERAAQQEKQQAVEAARGREVSELRQRCERLQSSMEAAEHSQRSVSARGGCDDSMEGVRSVLQGMTECACLLVHRCSFKRI